MVGQLMMLLSGSNTRSKCIGKSSRRDSDAGYPLREHLMTPVENAVEDSPEGRYNIKHKRARNLVERAFGVLKSRWRCLLAAREMHYAPRTAGRITIACAVLHNMCTDRGLDTPNLSQEDINIEIIRQPSSLPSSAVVSQTSAAALNQGRRTRDTLIQLLERTR
ncbi:putative nuclease HARBI1 [Operophtera brumata]|uniref:Putative nuclease HARBI1 n=1 Tax=Operophtera brumata TaxID=104452 RepID=A0A0L7L434_OPEBR|nr:putative nuclease HARBI1 [Operophtera brumata]